MSRIYMLLLSFLVLAYTPAAAQWAEFPTGALDSRTLRVQSKVESLYERGDYKRAFFIYSSELARLGDKYAQYMTGYMYQMGQGVPEDPVQASAWFRIAAERKAPEFIAVRDQLMQSLDGEQRNRSDELYVELRKEYSDLVLVMNLLVEDLDELRTARTGSRLSGGSSPVMVIDSQSGVPISAEHLRNRALRGAQARLDFVTARLDIEPLRADDAHDQVESLWERVRDYLSVVDDDSEAYLASP